MSPVTRPSLPSDFNGPGDEVGAERFLDIAGDAAEAMANEAEATALAAVADIELTPGPTGPTGATGATGATGPAGPTRNFGVDNNILCAGHPLAMSKDSGNLGAANRIFLTVVQAQATGLLKDLCVGVAATGGNAILGCYDTGQASAGNRTLLWKSASTAVGSANAWQNYGSPSPDVTLTLGEFYALAIVSNSTTPQFRGYNFGIGQLFALPTNFPSLNGQPPRYASIYNNGSFDLPTTIAESALTTTPAPAMMVNLIARIQ